MRRTTLWVALLLLAGHLAACGDDGEETTGGSGTTVATSSTTSAGVAGEPAEHAVADLAEELGVDESEISVMEAEQVTWPDSALGCPEEGQLYAQVLTEGWRIVLEHDGTRYHYHSANEGQPFLCGDPQPPVSGS